MGGCVVIRTRPSAMPRVWDCPSSMEPAAHPLNVPTDEAALGTAAHKGLAVHVVGLDPDLAAIAAEHAVEVDDLESLYRYGTKAWLELERYFPEPVAECQLDPTDITTGGQADVLHSDGRTLVINDWKSGRVRRNARWQMGAYAYGARAELGMPSSGVITTTVVWLRFGEFEVLEWDDAALDQFRARYIELEGLVGKQYAPGEHCSFCPRQAECGARSAFVRSSANSIASLESTAVTAEQLAALYPQAQLLERALKSYRAAVRSEVMRLGGLPLPDGRTLQLAERQLTEVDPKAAWPVLIEWGLTEDELARCTSIGKGKLEDLVGEKAPPKMKGKHKAQLFERLREAGALTTTTQQRLDVAKLGGE